MQNLTGTILDRQRLTGTLSAILLQGTGFNYQGEWSASTTYGYGEYVSIQSRLGLFKSLQADNTGNTPPATTDEWWQVVMAIPGGGVVVNDVEGTYYDVDVGTAEFTNGLVNNMINGALVYYLQKSRILAPADVWTARTTNGATFQVDETATNDQVKGGFYFSGTVSQGIQLQIKNLNNELFSTPEFRVKIHSKATNISELNSGVVWGIRGVWQGSAMDQAWSDPIYLTQNLADVNTIYSTAFSDEIRVTAPETLTNGSLLIEIYRAVSEVGDVNVNDAVILDVEILINQ